MSEEKELEKLRREIAELRDEVSLLEERHNSPQC
jgi:cell division protein FtsB